MAEDTLLQDAIEALRQGDRARAKDILTRLIKSDQNNASYWNWMSASVDTDKERIYCLQTALKLEPDNAAAKRGMVLLGAIPPDPDVEPFQINRDRLWEEELSLVDEEAEKESGFKAFFTSPAGRLLGLLFIAAIATSIVVFGLVTPRTSMFSPAVSSTPSGPTATFTTTPTVINAGPTATFSSDNPLWTLLEATYTPTPLYVQTQRAPQSGDLARGAREQYSKGNWDQFINSMEQIAAFEPEAADVDFYIGEAYRFMGEYKKAFDNYNIAIDKDPDFAPAYLGKARVIPLLNPGASNYKDIERTIERDPDYFEAYLELAVYYLNDKQPGNALDALEKAETLRPDSPFIYLYRARAHLSLGENRQALEAAQKANEMDITNLESYYTLALAYEATNKLNEAVDALETYVIYEPEDPKVLTMLGTAYNEQERYEEAIEVLTASININYAQGNARLQRGIAYVYTGEGKLAEAELKEAAGYLPDSFEISFSLGRAHMLQDHYGDAYLQFLNTENLTENSRELAQVYYWRALCLEELNQIQPALKDWENLVALPQNAVPQEWREEAEEHIGDLSTPTRTPTVTKTPTITRTPTVTRTPSPTSTKSPKPTRTPTPKP
ncbi:MAG: tetratricopeptide repeat protein [Anaerolineales bacterium]|nr:tetratricopeptide repeat protein [Anaerolineales bacterium]